MIKKLGNKLLIIHKEIQPIIHQDIQPVITTQIQPIIHREIQPVIFSEGHPNIEEAILQLNLSKNKEIRIEDLPDVDIKDLNLEGLEIQHYIMIEERHLTKREIIPSTKTEAKLLTKKEYVPYTPYGSKIQIPIIGPNTEKMETIIAVNFTSLDQKINYPIACKNTDIFQNVDLNYIMNFHI